MMRQGFVHERANDFSMTHNPHLMNSYPQWSRVNNFDKSRYPKPFVKDKLPQNVELRRELDDDDTALDSGEINPSQRAQYLERSLVFLKQQHQEVLRSLHEEIDMFKKENKDLQFRIVMSQKRVRSTRSAKNREVKEPKEPKEGDLEKELSSDSVYSKAEEESIRSRDDKLDEIKVVFMEEEIKELKYALRESRNRNAYLTQMLEQVEEQRKRQAVAVESMKVQLGQGGAGGGSQSTDQTLAALQQGSRPLSLAECHAVIRHLQQQNEQQSHELNSLKSDLQDVLYSDKWTPDAYLLAKAYIADDEKASGGAAQSKSALPRIPFKHPTKKLPEVAYIQRDNFTLPALKQTVSNRAIERRKRTQVLQKARLKNELIP